MSLGNLTSSSPTPQSDQWMRANRIRRQIFRDAIDVNLVGTWNTVRVAAPHMIDAGRGGEIVLASSIAALKAVT